MKFVILAQMGKLNNTVKVLRLIYVFLSFSYDQQDMKTICRPVRTNPF